jgi:hypothetical protein
MSDEGRGVVITGSAGDTALDIGAFVASAVPWVGGPISNVLGGISSHRKLTRVREVLQGFAEDLRSFKSDVSEEYVKTEDFEELLEETLRRVAAERAEERRRLYRRFLVRIVKEPGTPYDEQLRVLRAIEDIRPAHLEVLIALDSAPDANAGGIAGSPLQTLSSRLPGIGRDVIIQLVRELDDLRITNLPQLQTMMTPTGAADLRHAITPLGRSLMRYIRGDGGVPAA